MKKILIVEDTQANLEAAQSFFATIPGYEFLYAVNRKEAEALIQTADAVITDRNMPYEGIPKNPNFYQIENGYQIALYSKLLGKPTLMLTEHGRLGFGLVDVDSPGFHSGSEAAKAAFGKNISCLDDSGLEDTIMEACHRSGMAVRIDWRVEIPKTSIEAWKLGWEELQKQFL